MKNSMKNSKFMKTMSIVLVLVTLFSFCTVSASAAYSTGNYVIAASNGSNVRSGAGTGYSIVGAASKGVTFNVTKISGSWGYTSSIKCTNGTKSGWVCLDYCTYKGSSSNSSRATYNDVFASTRGSGYSLSQARAYEATTFTQGTFIYVWAFVHDINNNLYKSYSSGTCNMTLSIYRPNGSCAFSHTYNNSDNNWIGQKLDEAGTWKIQSKITGSLSGTNTRAITVKSSSSSSSTYYTLTYNANGGSNAPSPQRVKANTGFYLSSSKPTRSGYTFLGWSTNKNATSASYAPGAGVKMNSNVTLYAVWKYNNVKPTSISLNCTSYTMNVGNGKQLYATVYPSNASDKTVYWSSSDSRIASVSGSGRISAKAPGVATITAKTSNGKTSTCTVTVRGVVIKCSDLYLYPTVGDILYFSAKAYPSDTTSFKWT
ncbi:MAG: InlB B-repeat-containing protein, partial [Acutalibacteraceae bacterium]